MKRDHDSIGPDDDEAPLTKVVKSPFRAVIDLIHRELQLLSPGDSIHGCGGSWIAILKYRPSTVLDLADKKLHAWPFSEVSTCWRRLYEEASLWKVFDILSSQHLIASRPNHTKHHTKVHADLKDNSSDRWLTDVIHLLDRVVIIAGAPHRRILIEQILLELRQHVEVSSKTPAGWPREQIPKINFKHPVERATGPLEFEAFQTHIERRTTPLVIPDALTHWPAMERWQQLSYLMGLTLDGRRLVPVEIGSSYTDDGWTQKLMQFDEFVQDYLLPQQAQAVGYLAQHDLFTQIPSLKHDVSTPDYCWTTPPSPQGAAALTAGLSTASEIEEPMMNAWLGPKGTKTPLHTDPYHNILCQVVGYKYVRLYAPEETPNLYPRGKTDAGIDMSNTSLIDVFFFMPEKNTREGPDTPTPGCLSAEFPRFASAKYTEAVLAPGDCLYIPLGYWHYVESLTPSFSVSFWWN